MHVELGGPEKADEAKVKPRSTSSVPKNASAEPANADGPAPAPSSLSSTTGLPAGVPKLLQSTAFAATSCADGDRWVFMQDVAGNIRAAHYLGSDSSWTFIREQHNFTAAKAGTSMSASCVNITEDVGLALGTYVSHPCPGRDQSPRIIIEEFSLTGGIAAFIGIHQPVQHY